MACNLIEMHIAVINFQQKLRRTLQPCVQAAQANRFEQLAFVQIAQAHIGQPTHQKSSAEGMRVNAILPPVNPPGGGVQGPSVTTRLPNFRLRPSIAAVIVSQR